mmetsp:Transcript_19858/g.27557  ORF Transcript_19858/g.27557 Transcript_19858/m.27557 type:complete len:350 (+) Transcript_19858:163-1212(+)
MADVNARIEATKTEIANLKAEIEKTQAAKKDKTLGTAASGVSVGTVRTPPQIKCRRTLKGHFGKVTALHWGGNSKDLVSASQDGKLIIWNAVTTSKKQIINLKSNYVLTVGIEQERGKMVACGGLDNLCTVYNISQPENAIEMASHEGFLSCCRFTSEQHILTASGDSTAIRWDVPSGRVLDTFSEHTADVMTLEISPSNPNLFVTGSVDKTCKIWDVRDPSKSVHTLFGHTGDVNSVDFMTSDDKVFATASDDGTCRIFDTRAYNEVNQFGTLQEGEGFTSCSLTPSGRVLFAGHCDSAVVAYDVLAEPTDPAYVLQDHESHVTSVGVNGNGDALCTSSWDATLKIWA